MTKTSYLGLSWLGLSVACSGSASNHSTTSAGATNSVGGNTSVITSTGVGGNINVGGVNAQGGLAGLGGTLTSTGGTSTIASTIGGSAGINCALVGCGAPPLCSVGCKETCGCCPCSEGAPNGSLVCRNGCWAEESATGGASSVGGATGAGGASSIGGTSYSSVPDYLPGLWIVGWSGGLDHYSWIRFSTYDASSGGRIDILNSLKTGSWDPFFACEGTGKWYLTARPQTVDLWLPTACGQDARFTFSIESVVPASGLGIFSKASLQATLQALSSIPTGGNPIDAFKYPDSQCDAAMTSCTAPQ